MKAALIAIALMSSFAASASDPNRFGEICVGTERIMAANQPIKTVPYSIALSLDLVTGQYCYAECEAWQRYKIADIASDPIKLADINSPALIREIRLDRKAGTFTDHQVLNVLTRIETFASATCKPAPFRELSGK